MLPRTSGATVPVTRRSHTPAGHELPWRGAFTGPGAWPSTYWCSIVARSSDARLEEAKRLVETAYQIEPQPTKGLPPLVHRVIGA